jgi:hypothetical protein
MSVLEDIMNEYEGKEMPQEILVAWWKNYIELRSMFAVKQMEIATTEEEIRRIYKESMLFIRQLEKALWSK